MLYRFCLLIILLILGYSQTYAYTHKASLKSSSLKAFDEQEASAVRLLKINRDFITSARLFQTLNERATIDNVDTEDENELEDELTQDKQDVAVAKNNFAIFYIASAPQYLNFSIYKCLQDCKHFFYSSSRKKHIVFRVLRI